MNNPFDKLYDYQSDCVDILLSNDKGTACLPTGTGKTFIQAAIVAKHIFNTNPGFGIYVINAPRILLSFQIFREFFSFLSNCNLECSYGFVHSGGKDDSKEIEKIRSDAIENGNDISSLNIESGTSAKEIERVIIKGRKENIPVVFISTYHSCNKIQETIHSMYMGMTIDIVVNDEAHYLVQERFYEITKILLSNKCYFFTATMETTESDSGRGMNNEETYGKVLYKMTPKEAIDAGRIVRPKLLVLESKVKLTKREFSDNIPHLISFSYLKHQMAIENESAKLLVSTSGTKDIEIFLKSNHCKSLVEQKVLIFAISSNEMIGNYINGVQYNRPQFLKKLKEAGSNPKQGIIVLHYDILSEGVDVSGLNGVLFLRNMSKSKFCQTYGRTARLNSNDRKRFASKEITPSDLSSMVKPYSYIIIPIVTEDYESNAKTLKDVTSILKQYCYDLSDESVSQIIYKNITRLENNSNNNFSDRIFSDIADDFFSKKSHIENNIWNKCKEKNIKLGFQLSSVENGIGNFVDIKYGSVVFKYKDTIYTEYDSDSFFNCIR